MKKVLGGFLLLAIGGGFSTTLNSCNDPCDDSKKVSADFRTYNELNYFDKENGKSVQKIKIVEEDTFMLSNITFEAFEQNAVSYEWTIGSDPKKRMEKKFSLSFDDIRVLQESPISVKLKIEKNPDAKCHPEDSGIDSVTHYIYFLPYDNWPILGKYSGADDTDPTRIFTIEIYRDTKTQETFVTNLPNNCNATGKSVRISNSTAFEFTLDIIPATDINCYFHQFDKKIGYVSLGRKNIVIDYEFTEGGVGENQKTHRIFKGRKI